MELSFKTLNKDAVEAQTGYRPFTTFYEDFSIAEAFGRDAIRDTFNRAFAEWKSDYKYLTELVLILNWKSWDFAETDEETARLYVKLCEEADHYAIDTLKGEELNYFIRVTD